MHSTTAIQQTEYIAKRILATVHGHEDVLKRLRRMKKDSQNKDMRVAPLKKNLLEKARERRQNAIKARVRLFATEEFRREEPPQETGKQLQVVNSERIFYESGNFSAFQPATLPDLSAEPILRLPLFPDSDSTLPPADSDLQLPSTSAEILVLKSEKFQAPADHSEMMEANSEDDLHWSLDDSEVHTPFGSNHHEGASVLGLLLSQQGPTWGEFESVLDQLDFGLRISVSTA